MRVLVLGGYGLIGRHVTQELMDTGHEVVGAGRTPDFGRRLLPDARWIALDLSHLAKPDSWQAPLAGIDAVVNAAGALQSGGGTDLGRVQRDAIVALIAACEAAGIRRFVQISAPGALADAETEFLRTKGEADAVLRQSRLDWVILKPGLVIAAEAYGGTSLLRTLAAMPLVQPLALPDARMQSIGARELAGAVRRALEEETLARRDFDLVEARPHRLQDLVLAYRRWLGFAPPRRILALPAWTTAVTGRLADLAGRLGWPAPLRSTALRVMADDVLGDPAPWRQATGQTFAPLAESLRSLPATRQERVYARAQLVFPLALAVLALFWIASGLVGLARLPAAAALLPDGLGPPAAIGGALLDLLIGVGLLWRRSMRLAAVAAVVVCLAYALLATLFLPALWADPLGPLVKIFPAAALALVLAALAEPR